MSGMSGCFGIEREFAPYPYRYEVYGNGGGLFEGAEIISFSPDEVTLSVGKGILTVKGKGLSVKRYSEKEVLLLGGIESVCVERTGRRKNTDGAKV